jgi:hypothetical protein
VLARERAKILCARPDLCFVTLQDSDGLLLRAGDIGLYHQNMVLIKRGKLCGRREEVEAVGLTSFQLDGRREPLCLTRM